MKIGRFLIFLTLVNILLLADCSQGRADYVVVDHGDVVKFEITLNYKKFGEAPQFYYQRKPNIFIGDTPPDDIDQTLKQLWPKRDNLEVETMLKPFRDRVLGMRVKENRDFTIPAAEVGITNTSDIFYQADLLFAVKCLEFLYDLNHDPIFELTFDHPLFLTGVAVFVVFLGLLYYYRIPWQLRDKITHMLSSKCNTCDNPTKLICANPNCRKPVCRRCFQKEKGCPNCGSTKIRTKGKQKEL